jgi:hypothetical protein
MDEALPGHIAHFACHALSNGAIPKTVGCCLTMIGTTRSVPEASRACSKQKPIATDVYDNLTNNGTRPPGHKCGDARIPPGNTNPAQGFPGASYQDGQRTSAPVPDPDPYLRPLRSSATSGAEAEQHESL